MNYETRKQQVVEAYKAADWDTKRALTAAAIIYLNIKEGARVSKQSLAYWRDTTKDKSPFRHKYLAAYENAIKQQAVVETA